VKHEFDRGGVLTNGVTFFGGGRESTLAEVEMYLGTASPVTRWREAHPDLVGTEKDIVKAYTKDVQAVLSPGQDKVLQGAGMAILLFKKA